MLMWMLMHSSDGEAIDGEPAQLAQMAQLAQLPQMAQGAGRHARTQRPGRGVTCSARTRASASRLVRPAFRRPDFCSTLAVRCAGGARFVPTTCPEF
jgi:hypothetical protein